MMYCFNFDCPQRISVQGNFRVVDQFNVDIAGWHNGQRMSAQICLPFCTDACALHYLEINASGEDLPLGKVKTTLEVLESVLLAHQKWYLKNGGDHRIYPVNGTEGECFEPDYREINLPRLAEGLAVVSRVRVPTTWTKGESYAAIAFGFDTIETRAEFSRRLITADEKLTFFLSRAHQMAGLVGR